MRVGIPKDKGSEVHQDGPLDVASIGFVHEFGNDDINIPERSFVRGAFDDNLAENIAFARKLGLAIILRKITLGRAGAILGLRLKSQVLARLDAGIPPPLQPATIARKGSSKQLIDTEQLKRSIDFEVD